MSITIDNKYAHKQRVYYKGKNNKPFPCLIHSIIIYPDMSIGYGVILCDGLTISMNENSLYETEEEIKNGIPNN